MIKTILFPFHRKNSLLKKYWWHRLVVIVFLVVLVGIWFESWVWVVHNEETFRLRSICIQSAETTMTYNDGLSYNDPYKPADPGKVFEDQINKCYADYPTHPFSQDMWLAIIPTLILSYLLQLIYFKIIYYIIFGVEGVKKYG